MTDMAAAFNERASGRFQGLIGVRFISAEPDRVVAEIDVRDDLCTLPGIMHGGAIMAFADTLGAHGTALNLPNGAGTTTLESKTNFFSAGPAGTTVRGECVPLHRGKRTNVWQTRVTAHDGRLVAVVTQTQMVLDPARTPQQTIGALFEGKTTDERKALLAQLERGGAAVYRALAADETDAAFRAKLHAAADREDQNAVVLERNLGKESAT